ncbi:MAG: sulfotransferase family protein [Acidimicrobiia bacterium]
MRAFVDRTVDRARSEGRLAFGRLTASGRPLPDFVVIGVQRAGTTSLYRDLKQHPQVIGAATKEVHYFDYNHAKGLSWYRAHFPHRRTLARHPGAPPVTGEATPNYLFHPHAPWWVRSELPTARLIVVLRDPVRRAYSHWQLNRRIGLEDLSFEEAIDREEDRIAPDRRRLETEPEYPAYDLFRFSYAARGTYASQLERWFAAIPRSRFLVVRSEDLDQAPDRTFDRVTDFIGVERWRPPEYSHAHGSAGTAIPELTRRRLERFFEPHRRQLEELLGDREP